MSGSTDTIKARMRPTKPRMPLHAVAAALGKSMPGPVLARTGQNRAMLTILTTCTAVKGSMTVCRVKHVEGCWNSQWRVNIACNPAHAVPAELKRVPALVLLKLANIQHDADNPDSLCSRLVNNNDARGKRKETEGNQEEAARRGVYQQQQP